MERQVTRRTGDQVTNKARRNAKTPASPANDIATDILQMQQRFGNQAVNRNTSTFAEGGMGVPSIGGAEAIAVADGTIKPTEANAEVEAARQANISSEPFSPGETGAESDAAVAQTPISGAPAAQPNASSESLSSNHRGEESGADATQTTTVKEPIEAAHARAESSSALIVADSVSEIRPGQMRKSEFLAEVRAEVCRTVEEVIAPTGRSTADCPYLVFAFNFFARRSARNIERTLRRFEPQGSAITTPRDSIPFIVDRVRHSTEVWVRTGQITGLPQGVLPALRAAAAAPGSEARSSPTANVFFKEKAGGARTPGDPQAIQAQLGSGRPLDGSVKSRMESAFATDFSRVRVHTDPEAARLSNSYNARAFTVGEQVAFGTGEYQPGTLVGDALIAHELAHVLQQQGESPSAGGITEQGGALERDADKAAEGAVASLWSGAKRAAAHVSQNAMPRLRSGLRLSRCGKKQETPTPAERTDQGPATVSIGEVNAPHTPSSIKRIPPRVNTSVPITVQGSPTIPVTLSVEGAGSDNGSATINGSATHTVTESETVQLRGVDQTRPGNAGNLNLVARQGEDELAQSNPFSVAAYPIEIGFTFLQTIRNVHIPEVPPGQRVWAAVYTLTFNSDSGTDADCNRTRISENIIDITSSGLWAGGPATLQSGFFRTTDPQEDHHGTPASSRAQVITAMNSQPNIATSLKIQHQFFRFSCERSGIPEDRNAGPKVPTSGFKITHTASIPGGTHTLHVKKEGFANNGVSSGTVDDTSVKDIRV